MKDTLGVIGKYNRIFRIVLEMQETEENYQFLRDYFLEKYQYHPEEFHEFIIIFREELAYFDEIAKKKLANAYMHVFSFLCERYGIYEEKILLDDIMFHILQKEEYEDLYSKLQIYQNESAKIIEQIFTLFKKNFSKLPYDISYKGRYKNLYSIYKKCVSKNIDNVFQLSDIFAFRIIIHGTEENCYEVCNLLHNLYTPIPERFKDYIVMPKINGYQSIHTSLTKVIKRLDLPIEIQIRTKNMDNFAQSGVAAHFLYAQKKQSHLLTEKEQKIFKHFEQERDDALKNSIKKDEEKYVYCMSSFGDIYKLKDQSTIQDFAEKIHSKLPKKCQYALVNNEKYMLSEKIRDFDIIELIIT